MSQFNIPNNGMPNRGMPGGGSEMPGGGSGMRNVENSAKPSEASQRPPHVLYYSSACAYSAKFLQELIKIEDLSISVELICIEKLQRLPKGLVKVPTLICNVNDKEQSPKAYVGAKAFEWLNEMKAVSFDSYSFGVVSDSLGFASVDESGDVPVADSSNTFSFLDGGENVTTHGDPQRSTEGGTQKTGSNGFDAMMDTFMDNRNKEIPQPIRRMQ